MLEELKKRVENDRDYFNPAHNDFQAGRSYEASRILAFIDELEQKLSIASIGSKRNLEEDTVAVSETERGCLMCGLKYIPASDSEKGGEKGVSEGSCNCINSFYGREKCGEDCQKKLDERA